MVKLPQYRRSRQYSLPFHKMSQKANRRKWPPPFKQRQITPTTPISVETTEAPIIAATRTKPTVAQETAIGAPIQIGEEQEQDTAQTTTKPTTQQTQTRTILVKLAFFVVNRIIFRTFVERELAKMPLALTIRAKLTGQKSTPMKRLARHRFFSWRINEPLL